MIVIKDPLDDIFSQAEPAIDPLNDIFPQAKTTVISTIGAPVEKPLNLGELARIHKKGKTPPSTCKIGSLEFMFLQENKWYRFDSGLGKIIPARDDELKKYGDSSKYMLIGPISQESESQKIGLYDFALYELANRSTYR
jgi:hypothetical protein